VYSELIFAKDHNAEGWMLPIGLWGLWVLVKCIEFCGQICPERDLLAMRTIEMMARAEMPDETLKFSYWLTRECAGPRTLMHGILVEATQNPSGGLGCVS
jgi:hypothetical protein